MDEEGRRKKRKEDKVMGSRLFCQVLLFFPLDLIGRKKGKEMKAMLKEFRATDPAVVVVADAGNDGEGDKKDPVKKTRTEFQVGWKEKNSMKQEEERVMLDGRE